MVMVVVGGDGDVEEEKVEEEVVEEEELETARIASSNEPTAVVCSHPDLPCHPVSHPISISISIRYDLMRFGVLSIRCDVDVGKMSK